MKVCHISSLHPAKDHRIYFKECMSLARHGFETHLILCNQKASFEQGVRVHNIAFDFANRFDRIRKALKLCLAKAREIDAEVYHLHDPELLLISPALMKLGKKVIYDAHEDVPDQILGKPYIPKLIRPLVSKTFKWFEASRSRKISALVVANPPMMPRFKKYNRTTGIFNFPEWQRSRQTDWQKRENAICYIGTLTESRGIYDILEAIKDLDLKFYLAGNWHSASFEQKCRQHPSWSKVEFLGYIDQEKIYEVLSRVKIGISVLHPLKNYLRAYTGKMFEYMAAGVPVIVSDFELWTDVFKVAKCGLSITPANPEMLRSAIQQILSDDEAAVKMSALGQEAARRHFSWQSEQQKLIDLYNTI